jgi:Ca2+-binding RTX toxin-like protein
MPIQKEDRSTQWILDQDSERWVLAKNAKITVTNADAIYEGATGSEIVVNGDIKVFGAEASGVRFMSSTSKVRVGEDSFIDAWQAQNGILATGASQAVENHGRIGGSFAGVNYTLWGSFENHGVVKGGQAGVVFYDGDGPSEVRNFGRIEALYAVVFAEGGESVLSNGRKGVIDGEEYAVAFASSVTIRNNGVIRGDIFGVPGEASPFTQLDLVNKGEIVGDIRLGARASVIDSLNGKIFGEIIGGESGDVYKISQSKLEIAERTGWGFDEVHSTVSYRLSQEIEVLRLVGTGKMDATGNYSDNDLYGNGAANRISGLNGADELHGAGGSDTLAGGLGMDTFYFVKGDGSDIIVDFEDSVDHISVYAVQNQEDFDRLKVRQTGDDVVIDLGKGNQILLRDFDLENLGYSDFS